jgi:hypothetical protein
MLFEQLREVPAAERAEVADDVQPVLRRAPTIQVGEDLGPRRLRHEQQRLFVHRAEVDGPVVLDLPAERVQSAFAAAGVRLQALLHQAGDRRLRRTHRPMQQQHAAFDAEAVGGGLDVRNELGQRLIEAEDRVLALVHRIIEEPIVRDVFADLGAGFAAVRQHHVVHALVGIADRERMVLDQLEVVLQTTFPMELAVLAGIDSLLDQVEVVSFRRRRHSGLPGRARRCRKRTPAARGRNDTDSGGTASRTTRLVCPRRSAVAKGFLRFSSRASGFASGRVRGSRTLEPGKRLRPYPALPSGTASD